MVASTRHPTVDVASCSCQPAINCWARWPQPMWFVLLASALVVLGACVNVGNLILVRQAGRHRELAVRSALGAGRGRLVRQLMIEAAVLALFGGIGGVALAFAGLKGLVAIAPESVGRLDNASINGAVLLWTGRGHRR